MILQDTPVEEYRVNTHCVFVKREDLAVVYNDSRLPSLPFPPPFAKVRGLYEVLIKLKQRGVQTVSYMDTSVSMAGWGISYFCHFLGMKSVIYYPLYKEGLKGEIEKYSKICRECGAEVIFLERPNRQKINFYRAKKLLKLSYPEGVILSQGLPFDETVEAVSRQASLLPKTVLGGTIVINVGSGTMLAGVLKGLCKVRNKWEVQAVKGILAAPKNIDIKRKFIFAKAGILDAKRQQKGLLLFDVVPEVEIIDYGYEYTQKEEVPVLFPCNIYYDRKAWKWLLDNIEVVKKPILFWNIGG